MVVAALVALACLRFGYGIYAGAGQNRGDFFDSMPGRIVETINTTLWQQPGFTETYNARHTYVYGPTQYLTILPFLFADSFDALATALLWLHVPLTLGAAIYLWKMARILAPSIDRHTSLMAVVTAMGLFFPLLYGFVAREFEIVCFAVTAAAAYLLVAGRPAGASGLLAYTAWFKMWPLVFVLHDAARRRYKSVAVFGAVSAAVVLAADLVFGLEYFTIFAFIGGDGHGYLSGLSNDTGFCATRHRVSLAGGFCAIGAQLAGFPPRLALIATVGAIALAAGLTFVALERRTLSERDRTWRDFLEFSLILTVALTFLHTAYYYFAFLLIPIVGLGARYFAPGSAVRSPRRALLVLSYLVLGAFVVPMSVLSRLAGTDFWTLYNERGLYLAGELGLLSLLVGEYVGLGLKAAPANAPFPTDHVGGWRHSVPWLAIAVASLAILTTRTWAKPANQGVPPPRQTAISLKPPEGWQFVSAQVPVVSPDGSRVAMIARASDGTSALWTRPTTRGEPTVVSESTGAGYPFWAPDGSAIAFFAGGWLKVATLSTGEIRALAPAPSPRGGSWSRDGVLLFAPHEAGPLVAMPAAGGDRRTVTRLNGDLGHQWPRFLDDGVHFLYVGTNASKQAWTYIGSLAVDERMPLGILGATYGSGEIVHPQGSELLSRPFDPKLLLMGNATTRLTGSLLPPSEGVRSYAISDGGPVSFWNDARLTRVSRDGKWLGEAAAEMFRQPRVSPDRRLLAVAANSVIYLLSPETLEVHSWLTSAGSMSAPAWSPDGRRLAFAVSLGESRSRISVIDLDTRQEMLVAERHDRALSPEDWTSDGRDLIVQSTDPHTRMIEIYRVAVRPEAVLERITSGSAPRISPDGRWLAFVASDGGRRDVYIAPYPNVAPRWRISPSGGDSPVWNGRELLYREGLKMVRGVPAMTASGRLELTSREVLFEGSYADHYDVTDEGRTFIVVTTPDHPDRVHILSRTAPGSARVP
jgi:Tol biopolymer transport system component